MKTAPDVSIIIPTYNDEAWVAAALDSCRNQTLRNIEIICVDDASTDGTPAIIKRQMKKDPRIRLIELDHNSTAFQARRVGVETARAQYLMFVDGDDELMPRAARVTLDRAHSSKSDIVGFGVHVIMPDGRPRRSLETALAPKNDSLLGEEILPGIFPVGDSVNGHVWRYLFKTDLVRSAYNRFPQDLVLSRANDLPVSFLVMALAKRYASVPDKLYRYYFRRGTSGHQILNAELFAFYVGALKSIAVVETPLREMTDAGVAPRVALACYESARLSVLGNILGYCTGATDINLQDECYALLTAHASEIDMIRAAAHFCPRALPILVRNVPRRRDASEKPHGVLLATADLKTGGVQTVVAAQVRSLVEIGHAVSIAVHRQGAPQHDLPPAVQVTVIDGNNSLDRLDEWIKLCSELRPSIIIDHHIFYNRMWPFYALAANTLGIATIGWLHSFALRPLHDNNDNTSFLRDNASLLETVVVLSPTDVAFWKLEGVSNVAWLPNPPSQMALSSVAHNPPREAPTGKTRLVWWGRLQQSTKRVRSLIPLVGALRQLGVDAELVVIGPDSRDLTAAQLLQEVSASGLEDHVRILGPLTGQPLVDELESSHVVVSTSVIEGYLYTLVEAQVMGLPVAMYELPWLVNALDNDGLITAPQGDAYGLARKIKQLVEDPERYMATSMSAQDAGRKAMDFDYNEIYELLLRGELSAEYSPPPSLRQAGTLVRLMTAYAEVNARRSQRDRKELGDLRRRIRKLQSQVDAYRKLRSLPIRAVGKIRREILKRVAKTRAASHTPSTSTRTTTPVPPLPSMGSDATIDSRTISEIDPSIDVSVIIPVYNAAPWLAECLSSVLTQSDVSLEVICINDGSTDTSPDILEDFASKDTRIRVLNQANSGQSVGRNVGLDAARGRYAIFLDSDDYWSSNALSSLVDQAEQHHLDVLLFEGRAVRDDGIEDELWNRYATYYQRSGEYPDVCSGSDLIAAMRRRSDYRVHVGLYLASTAYVRRLDNRFIPGIVHQDNPYTFRLLLNARRAAHSSTLLYARRVRAGSTITTLKAANSAKGYFLSYVAMSREISRFTSSESVNAVLAGIVHDVFRASSNQFRRLPTSIGDQLGTLDSSIEAQIAFRTLKTIRDSV